MQNEKNHYNPSMSRFGQYLIDTFQFSSDESEEIMYAMKEPIGKSIRINTRKIALTDFKIHAKKQGWILTDTDIPEVFLIDRDDTTIALGNTIEHMAGWFYIQEVAAAHPPFLLHSEVQKKNPIHHGIIIDMCAAPGGKTTQLADYFADSLIIANEVNRTRTPQLFDNLDRMGYDNIAVVSCDGRFFQNFPDFFDAVLLDAPCSGEGTAFRDSSVIDHWNEKNIHRIAKLQKQLIETAETIVKPAWMISYSTCTLNTIENEEVIDSRLQQENTGLKEIFRKRFWPHIEHTGWFFASIFQKKKTENIHHEYPILAAQGQKNLIVTPATKWERETVERFISKHLKTKLKDGFLYLTKDGVYFNQKNLGPLADYFYFVHAGARIGTMKKNIFTPMNHLFWCVEDTSSIIPLEVTSEMWNEILARKSVKTTSQDGYYSLTYCGRNIGIGEVRKGEFLWI